MDLLFSKSLIAVTLPIGNLFQSLGHIRAKRPPGDSREYSFEPKRCPLHSFSFNRSLPPTQPFRALDLLLHPFLAMVQLRLLSVLGIFSSLLSLTLGEVAQEVLTENAKRSNESLLWGPYRPNLYFGVRPRIPKSLLTGLLWAKVDSFQGVQNSTVLSRLSCARLEGKLLMRCCE